VFEVFEIEVCIAFQRRASGTGATPQLARRPRQRTGGAMLG
jgi:hypothetical protein